MMPRISTSQFVRYSIKRNYEIVQDGGDGEGAAIQEKDVVSIKLGLIGPVAVVSTFDNAGLEPPRVRTRKLQPVIGGGWFLREANAIRLYTQDEKPMVSVPLSQWIAGYTDHIKAAHPDWEPPVVKSGLGPTGALKPEDTATNLELYRGHFGNYLRTTHWYATDATDDSDDSELIKVLKLKSGQHELVDANSLAMFWMWANHERRRVPFERSNVDHTDQQIQGIAKIDVAKMTLEAIDLILKSMRRNRPNRAPPESSRVEFEASMLSRTKAIMNNYPGTLMVAGGAVLSANRSMLIGPIVSATSRVMFGRGSAEDGPILGTIRSLVEVPAGVAVDTTLAGAAGWGMARGVAKIMEPSKQITEAAAPGAATTGMHRFVSATDTLGMATLGVQGVAPGSETSPPGHKSGWDSMPAGRKSGWDSSKPGHKAQESGWFSTPGWISGLFTPVAKSTGQSMYSIPTYYINDHWNGTADDQYVAYEKWQAKIADYIKKRKTIVHKELVIVLTSTVHRPDLAESHKTLEGDELENDRAASRKERLAREEFSDTITNNVLKFNTALKKDELSGGGGMVLKHNSTGPIFPNPPSLKSSEAKPRLNGWMATFTNGWDQAKIVRDTKLKAIETEKNDKNKITDTAYDNINITRPGKIPKKTVERLQRDKRDRRDFSDRGKMTTRDTRPPVARNHPYKHLADLEKESRVRREAGAVLRAHMNRRDVVKPQYTKELKELTKEEIDRWTEEMARSTPAVRDQWTLERAEVTKNSAKRHQAVMDLDRANEDALFSSEMQLDSQYGAASVGSMLADQVPVSEAGPADQIGQSSSKARRGAKHTKLNGKQPTKRGNR